MQDKKQLARIVKWYETGRISEREYRKKLQREKKRQKKIDAR